MALDLSSLRSALAALDKSLGFLDSELAKDPDLREQFRAAAIQAFEFTHELSFKLLKRQLEAATPDPAALDRMSYMDVIRTAAEAGLISDVGRFRKYRENRNLTSHIYHAATAENIVKILADFRRDVAALLAELERRNHKDPDHEQH